MLHSIHKAKVKAMLRKGNTFKGYIAPCNVSRFHVNHGWHIGMPVEFSTIESMEETVQAFAIYNCIPELGMRVRFWIEN